MALETFIADLKLTKRQLELAGPLIVNKLAITLVEELRARVPDQGTNPGNTGTLKRVITEHTPPIQEGNNWVVYIGPLDKLGRRGVREFEPYPIRRFLEDYRKKQAAEQVQKAEYEKLKSDQRTERKRQQAQRKSQEKVADRQRRASKRQKEVDGLRAEMNRVASRIQRLDEALYNYRNRIDEWRRRGYDLGKEGVGRKKGRAQTSYRDVIDKRDRAEKKRDELMDRWDKLYEQLRKKIRALYEYRRAHGLHR